MSISGNSTVQFKADIAKLRSGIQAVQRQIRLATTEFEKSTAGLDDWTKSAEGLQAKVKQLNTTLSAQKKQLELARTELSKVEKAYGSNSAEADRARMKVNGYETAVAKTEKELGYYEKELDDAKNKTGKFAEQTEKLDDAMEDVSDGFTTAKGVLANLVADGINLAIKAFKDLAKQAFEAGASFESGMSKVRAISGASAEDMELLTEKAKEMGEKTIFSASESAAAFEYMAMAGWKTEDMLSGIEGIMNLAAASGEDLATTSDIVTDALTAMGYTAGDATRLADVMAAASANANTNVGLMGSTFQYAAPIIGALGYSMEDTAVAIGMMANAGIKGTKAGTALRSMLTNLSSPGKKAKESMEELGITLTDDSGRMLSFEEVIDQLRKAFSNLTETEKTHHASQLAGKTAMSGLLAIVNASTEDYNKLSAAVEGSAGASQEMADIMNDNVNGQLTLLKSKIEGIYIEIFDSAKDSIKDAVNTISGALDGINWNNVGKVVGEAVKKLADFLKWLVKNADVIFEFLKSAAKIMATIWAVKKISQWAGAINTAITVFKGFSAAIKAGSTAMEAASTAGGLFAKLISPGGAIVLGIAAVVAVTASLISIYGEEERAIKILTDEQQAEIDKAHELKKAYDDMASAKEASMKDVDQEFGYYEDLKNELDSLVGANGKVKAGYEDRVQYIITTLNQALGTEMEMVDGVIQNYAKERQELERLMKVKKAQAYLDANQGAFQQALKNRDEAARLYAENQNILNEVQKQYDEAFAAYDAIFHDWDSLGPTAAANLLEENKDIVRNFEAARDALASASSGARDAMNAWVGYNAEIANYESLSTSLMTGDAKAMEEAQLRIRYSIIDATNGTEAALKKQHTVLKSEYESLKKAYEDHVDGITASMVEEARQASALADKELQVFRNQRKATEENFASYNHYAEIYGPKARKAAQKVSDESVEALDKKEDFEKQGNNNAEGYVGGIEDYEDEAYDEGEDLAEESIDGLDDELDAHSPSRTTYKRGEFFGQGYINGMASKSSAIYQKAYQLAKAAVSGLKKGQEEGSPSKITYESGVYFTQGYINGMASLTDGVIQTAKKLARVAITEGLRVNVKDLDEQADRITSILTDRLSKLSSYTADRLKYENEQKIKQFDEKIAQLEAELATKGKTETIKIYNEMIATQKKLKEDYQTASAQMLSSYTTAMSSYQTQAQKLISTTISNIASKYEAEYDALVEKQAELSERLKDASALYEISGAGIMTIADIDEQTKEIKAYSDRLMQIRSKVSEELFDEIVNMDTREGSAFMERLLGMSEKDLQAYNAAYSRKIKAAKEAGNIYGKDLAGVNRAYKAELADALDNLPQAMEELGIEAMRGFVDGLTSDTDYMNEEIKTFVAAMVDTIKEELDIHSPSLVMERLGEFTGEGFVDGLKDTISQAKKAAATMAQAVSVPLDRVNAGGYMPSGSSTVYNYNLVQNNTSPKSLSALETYRARRQQIALVKALT